MSRPVEEFYYSRNPTESAPVTALVGPFASNAETRQRLIDDVKRSEDDLPTARGYGPYKILKVVGEVQPVITHNVRLKTL